MKTKLSIFRITLILFILMYSIGLLWYLLIVFTGEYVIPNESIRNSFFSTIIHNGFYIYLGLDIIKDILLIYALILLLKTTDYYKNEHYFTQKIILLLKFSGKVFIIVAVIGMLNSVFYHYIFSEYFIESMLLPIILHVMTFVIGLGVLVIEESHAKGLIVQQENDLTI